MKLNSNSRFILIFLLGAISFWAYNKYAFPTVESKIRPIENRIAIIGAMDEEVNIIKNQMELDTVIKKAGISFYLGKISNNKIVVLRCGIAKVNAALATQILIDDFNTKKIINTGVAGGLNPNIEIGEIVIAHTVQHHDIDMTELGFKPGEIARMDTSIYYSNRSMMSDLLELSRQESIVASYGKIISGEQFIASNDKKISLENMFRADAVDMESAAIAQVAYLNNLPFVIVRTISDKADGNAPENYVEFEKKAAEKSAALVISYLKSK